MIEFDKIGNFKLSTIDDSSSLHFILLANAPKEHFARYMNSGERFDMVIPLGSQRFMLRDCKFIKGTGTEGVVAIVEGTTEGLFEIADDTVEEQDISKPGFYYDDVNYGQVPYLNYNPDLHIENVDGSPTLKLQKTVTGAFVMHSDVFEFPFHGGVKFNNVTIVTEEDGELVPTKFRWMIMKTPCNCVTGNKIAAYTVEFAAELE